VVSGHAISRYNAELTGGFSAITAAELLVIAEVLPVERLVPEAQSAEGAKPASGKAGQLRIPAALCAAGTID
jgi:hypothetical protein